jgi:hypothetical protein
MRKVFDSSIERGEQHCDCHCIVNIINALEMCNAGWGVCLENAEIPKEMLSIAVVPTYDSITIAKQRERTQEAERTI